MTHPMQAIHNVLLHAPNGNVFTDSDGIIYDLAELAGIMALVRQCEETASKTGEDQIIAKNGEGDSIEVYRFCTGTTQTPEDTGWLYSWYPTFDAFVEDWPTMSHGMKVATPTHLKRKQ